ncbi:MAG: hypothetical protein P8078_02875 [bacterium]
MIYLTDNLRNNKEGFNTLVFDVDGVLVDTTDSYTRAVLEAVSLYGTELDGYDWKPESFHFNQFKAIRGFNNDWDVAEAMLLYFLQNEILKNSVSFSTYISHLAQGGDGAANVLSWITSRENREANRLTSLYEKEKIRRYSMEYYAGSNRCKSFFGFDPLLNNCPGTIENEKLLVDTDLLDRYQGVKGVYTGRNYYEFLHVLEQMGYAGWNKEFCFYDDSQSPVKPDPQPLCTIADSSQCRGIIFVGDSRDVFETVKNFTQQRPDFLIEFVQIMRQGSRFDCSHSALDDINQLLYFLLWEIS